MPEIRLTAKIENLRKMMQFVSDFAKGEGFNQKKIREIELAMEEALLNIIQYAYPDDRAGDIEINCRMEAPSRLIIDILDEGKPFDIRSAPEPDLNQDLSERKIGGLGIYLITQIVDEVHYRREGTRNVLTFVLHKKGDALKILN